MVIPGSSGQTGISLRAALVCFKNILRSFLPYEVPVTHESNQNPSVQSLWCLAPLCEWTDGMLYAKYELTQEEINLIETTIRPME